MMKLKIEVLKLFLLEFVWDRKSKDKVDEEMASLPDDNPATDNK